MLTAKQENFAEAVGMGATLTSAYQLAYNAVGMSKPAIHVEASRLAKNTKVALRVEAYRRRYKGFQASEVKQVGPFVMEHLQEISETAKSDHLRVRALELMGMAVGLF